MSKCRICHRPIKDLRSLERGAGPICYARRGGQEDMFSPKAPVYDFYLREIDGVKVLCIVDLYDAETPSLTVTNGAELVLAQIAQVLGNLPEMIIYRDSEGEWDRLKVKPEGQFMGFAPIVKGMDHRITDESEAVQLAAYSLAPRTSRATFASQGEPRRRR